MKTPKTTKIKITTYAEIHYEVEIDESLLRPGDDDDLTERAEEFFDSLPDDDPIRTSGWSSMERQFNAEKTSVKQHHVEQ